MARKYMRSPLGRASGLGSAKEGVEYWWRERVTAVALIPLALWFIASMVAHAASDYAVVSTLMMVLLMVALFYHTALGLQVIIEDYVHSAAKIPALIIMRLGCFALATVGVLAVLHVALSG